MAKRQVVTYLEEDLLEDLDHRAEQEFSNNRTEAISTAVKEFLQA